MTNSEIKLIIFLGVITFLLLSLLFEQSTRSNLVVSNLKKEAIELNYADYNRTNGVWQWKTNSVEK